MKYLPNNIQKPAIEHAVDFLYNAKENDKQLYAGPTGIGKSVIELYVQRGLELMGKQAWIITPSVEIIIGLIDKLGYDTYKWSFNYLQQFALQLRITTPVKFRNMLYQGMDNLPDALIFDEGHHFNAESWEATYYLCGKCPSIALTATPYCGSPKRTAKFRDTWGEPIWIIDYPNAIAEGLICMPEISIVPLVDDDTIEITNGEYNVRSVNEATTTRLKELVKLAGKYYDATDMCYDKATMISLPSSLILGMYTDLMVAAGFPCLGVTDETSIKDRQQIFALAESKKIVLAYINVVSEGVDLRMRRMIDAAPCLSPRQFMQRFGRIMRPTNDPNDQPEYIGTNRNFERHAYLLAGCVPLEKIKEVQNAFPTRSTVKHQRALGFEGLGRFKAIKARLASGIEITAYFLSTLEGHCIRYYAVIIHPAVEEPYWATRMDGIKADKSRDYGHWVLCDAPKDIVGFASIHERPLTDGQRGFWSRFAESCGLDESQELNNKNFQVCPLMKDLRLKFR